MARMYKVFVENRLILFVDKHENFEDSGAFLRVQLEEHLGKILRIRELIPIKVGLLVVCNSIDEALNLVFEGYSFLETGGGVVVHNGQVLVIERFDLPDLPKGKLEEGESSAEGAMREVEEECGIRGMTLEHLLCVTYHTYTFKDVLVLKKNYWYVMGLNQVDDLVPQVEEGITRVYFVPIDRLKEEFRESYASIQSVIDSFLYYYLGE